METRHRLIFLGCGGVGKSTFVHQSASYLGAKQYGHRHEICPARFLTTAGLVQIDLIDYAGHSVRTYPPDDF